VEKETLLKKRKGDNCLPLPRRSSSDDRVPDFSTKGQRLRGVKRGAIQNGGESDGGVRLLTTRASRKGTLAMIDRQEKREKKKWTKARDD